MATHLPITVTKVTLIRTSNKVRDITETQWLSYFAFIMFEIKPNLIQIPLRNHCIKSLKSLLTFNPKNMLHINCKIPFSLLISSQLLQLVQIMPFLLPYRNILPDLFTVTWIDVIERHIGVFIQWNQHLAKWIDQCRVTPCLVNFWIVFILSTTYPNGIALGVKGATSQ